MSQDGGVSKAELHRQRQARAVELHGKIVHLATSVASAKSDIMSLAFEVYDGNLFRLHESKSFVKYLMTADVSRSYAYDLGRFAKDTMLRQYLEDKRISLDRAAIATRLRRFYNEDDYRMWLEVVKDMSYQEASAEQKTRRQELVKAGVIKSGVTVTGTPDVVEVDVSDERCVVAAKIDAILAANDARLVSLFLAYVDKTYAKVSS